MKKIRIFVITLCFCLIATRGLSYIKPKDINMDVKVTDEYVSNLFYVPESRENTFDSFTGQGGRYEGLSGPKDNRFTIEGNSSADWKIAKKRYISLSGKAKYVLHLKNSIANYFLLKGKLGYDLSKKDQIKFGFYFVPERLKKNYYTYTEIGKKKSGKIKYAKTYKAAYYNEAGFNADYIFKWSNDMETGVKYDYANRGYNNPFSGRDRRTHQFTVFASIDINTMFKISEFSGFAIAKTDKEWNPKKEFSRDRSYNKIFTEAELTVDLPHKWWVFIDAEYSKKNYTSSVANDTLYYNRGDNEIDMSVGVKRELSKQITVYTDISVKNKTSKRPKELSAINQDVSYNNKIVGAGLRYEF